MVIERRDKTASGKVFGKIDMVEESDAMAGQRCIGAQVLLDVIVPLVS